MDDESKELVQAITEAGVEGFFNTVAAPLVEIGGWGADLIRRYRFRSAVKTAVLADAWLRAAGIEPQAVSLNVLVPILEYASLQDDVEESPTPGDAGTMQERWAALLANAAAGGGGASVFPSFPRILSEMVPLEAAG